MPILGLIYARSRNILLGGQGLLRRGPLGSILAIASFGSLLMATRLGKIGEAAVLRETSTVFAALIGWVLLKGTVGLYRVLLIAMIALGDVIVEFAE